MIHNNRFIRLIFNIRMLAMAAAAITATACSETDDYASSTGQVGIASATLQPTTATPQSRVAVGGTSFVQDDEVSVFKSATDAEPARYKLNNGAWQSDAPLYWDNLSMPCTLYACYPATATCNTFTMPTDQSGSNIEAANYMTATTGELSGKPDDGKISLAFTHRMSRVVIELKNGSTAVSAPLIHAVNHCYKDDAPSATDATDTNLSVTPHTSVAGTGSECVTTYTALLVPGSKSAHTLISFTASDKTQTFTTDVAFEANKVYHYKLQLNGTHCQLTSLSVSDWNTKEATAGEMKFYWKDRAATGFEGGSGTKASPYIIKTAEQLAYLAYKVNSGTNYSGNYFEQDADIDLSGGYWTPIGKGTANFRGNYQGGGYKISNLTVSGDEYAGLFGYVNVLLNAPASLKGINLTDADVNGTQSGAIAGRVDTNVLIAGCMAQGTVSGTANCGGLVGHATTSSVLYCLADVEVNAPAASAGGLVGCANYGVTMTSCFTKGSINGASGHTGLMIGQSNNNNNTLNYCAGISSSPSLCGYGNCTDNGCSTDQSNALATLTNSEANATFANLKWTGSECWDNSLVPTEEARTGTVVIVTSNISSEEGLRGMESYKNYKLTSDITVTTDWTPMGLQDITLDGDGHTITVSNVITSSSRTVGFFSNLSGTCTISNLTLKLKGVSTDNGSKGVGGLVGYNTGTLTIDNCHVMGTENTSNIVSTDNYARVGGLVGYNNSGTLTIARSSSSINISSVSGYGTGGLVGRNEGKKTYIAACYSSGEIACTGENIGGLVGQASYIYGNTYIHSCYSSCTFSSNDKYNTGRLLGDCDACKELTYCASTNITKPSDEQEYGIGSYNFSGIATGTQVGVAASVVYGIVANSSSTATITIGDKKYYARELWSQGTGEGALPVVNMDATPITSE